MGITLGVLAALTGGGFRRVGRVLEFHGGSLIICCDVPQLLVEPLR